jgi:hypothetical protein
VVLGVTDEQGNMTFHVPQTPSTGEDVGIQATNYFFSVHPNGGDLDRLGPTAILGANPKVTVVVGAGCGGQALTGATVEMTQRNVSYPSGGHGSGHALGKRPLGTYSPRTGTIGTDGLFRTTYTANVASGDEEVVARISSSGDCGGVVELKSVARVAVPSLSPIPQHPNLSFLAPTSDHPGPRFWYLRQDAMQRTLRLADLHRRKYGIPLLLTAAALSDGGINDVVNNWRKPHAEHRVGTDIDIDEQAGNDQRRLEQISELGKLAGFASCDPHRTKPGGPLNHVHCRTVLYR